MTGRRPPKELFESLLDYELDDAGDVGAELPAIEALPVAQRDAELRAVGVDPDALRARGAAHADAILDKLGAPPPAEPNVVSAQPAHIPATGAPKTLWLWVALAIVVVGAVLRAVLGKDGGSPRPPDTRSPEEHADAGPDSPRDPLIAARTACDQSAWSTCLRALGALHVEQLDPAQAAEARALRDAANRGLAEQRPDAVPEEPRKASRDR
jgi:hypothetical protein